MPYFLVYLHQKQSSKIGLETRPIINLWGLGPMTLSTILIVHFKGKIASSRKPVLGHMMSKQNVIIIEGSTKPA